MSELMRDGKKGKGTKQVSAKPIKDGFSEIKRRSIKGEPRHKLPSCWLT